MDLERALSLGGRSISRDSGKILQYINLKLAALGQPFFDDGSDREFLEIAHTLIENHQEKNRMLSGHLCPVDRRIQAFLASYLDGLDEAARIRLPTNTFVLDRHGLARVLSLPPDRDDYVTEILSSFRLKQGVLHNPRHDRRTTRGVFHIAEGGLPIPDDKKSVPRAAFAGLLRAALEPPEELLTLPYTASQREKARLFVSLLLRPTVSPEVPGLLPEKSLEIRFFAPGALVSNLDFVESIFGNAGDPYLPRNDAALDSEHWTGHTGCVILAPHLTSLTKRALGLPHRDQATERQVRDGMCWEREDEPYNDGSAFKVTCRDERGVIVTVIADNYFGYSKKEVKTQIGFSANLFGNCEEEHAGGAIAFPSYVLGGEFVDYALTEGKGQTFRENSERYVDFIEAKPEGYGVDRLYPAIIYIPEDARFSLHEQSVSWVRDGARRSIPLLADKIYLYPSGYKVRLRKIPGTGSWRLIGTVAEGVLCHKPCTVSGGGKSEISKSISDFILYGPFYIADSERDFELARQIILRDYSRRFRDPADYSAHPHRPVLSPDRSLGSVIKMLTPSESEFRAEYNKWLRTIPPHVKSLVCIVKRFYKPEWGDDWERHFSVDTIDGRPGNELKFQDRKLVAAYLRVGIDEKGKWRTYRLRQDFVAADKLQIEDDITASVVVPADAIDLPEGRSPATSVKFVHNCEYRFFQRPDEAIHRGFDTQAEADLARPDNFISNFEPLTVSDAESLVRDAVGFDRYTEPMQRLIREVAERKDCAYFVSSAHPRIVDGKPSRNPRYLQTRQDMLSPLERYTAHMGARLRRRIPPGEAAHFGVDAILPGRSNNPPEPGVRPLAVYNPIHYQELPELFMDFVCSLTGRSPSTTGAGSEGALTKGPFNALCPVTDLNNALVSFILCGFSGFTTAAGYIGPKYRVDHDISLLIPEIWCRLSSAERDPTFLMGEGHLEKLEDFEHNGLAVPASRLGYRITRKFVHTFFGRVFENPTAVFNEEMLQPERQDLDVFVDGITNIVEAQKRVAVAYFNDGSVAAACPPLRALLHILAEGHFEGKSPEAPEIRSLFTLDHLLASDWYQDRLLAKQLNDIGLWQRHLAYLDKFTKMTPYDDVAGRLGLVEKRESAAKRLAFVKSAAYLKSLRGTIGLDPIYRG
jgi:phosphoenolpyruvate carboxykinase (diphosphate)